MSSSNELPSSNSASARTPIKKRLFVCCDGTWQDAIGSKEPASNVARLSRCIKPVDNNGTPQIVYYQTGIGIVTSRIARFIDGAIGRGIDTIIRNAYNFICLNFDHPDDKIEIFLIGFSRGAFTVCCLALLIQDLGLLTRIGLQHLHELYPIWEEAMSKPQIWERARGNRKDGSVEMKLERLDKRVKEIHAKTSDRICFKVKIQAIGIWDAVSALQFPFPLHFPQPRPKMLGFIHERVPNCAQHFYHALALNEDRKHFKPFLWRPETGDIKSCPLNMKQCWFIGSHTDIGGGSKKKTTLSNLTLVWMMSNLKDAGADFDEDILSTFLNLNEPAYREKSDSDSETVNVDFSGATIITDNCYSTATFKVNLGQINVSASWKLAAESFNKTEKSGKLDEGNHAKLTQEPGLVNETRKGIYRLGGRKSRTPGNSPNKISHQACNEFVHWSVRLILEAQQGSGRVCPVMQRRAMLRIGDDGRPFWINPMELMGILEEVYRTGETPDKLVELYEDCYSKAEERIVRRWIDDAPKEHEFPAFLRPLLDEIKNPKRLYVNRAVIGVENLVRWYAAWRSETV